MSQIVELAVVVFVLEGLCVAVASSGMRRNGFGGRPVLPSVSTTKLLQDRSYLSPRGQRYRIATLVFLVAMAVTFRLVSVIAPRP